MSIPKYTMLNNGKQVYTPFTTIAKQIERIDVSEEVNFLLNNSQSFLCNPNREQIQIQINKLLNNDRGYPRPDEQTRKEIIKEYFSLMNKWLNLHLETETDVCKTWRLNIQTSNIFLEYTNINQIRPIYFNDFIKKMLYYDKYYPKDKQTEGIFDVANYTIKKEHEFLRELNDFFYNDEIIANQLNRYNSFKISSTVSSILKNGNDDFAWRLCNFKGYFDINFFNNIYKNFDFSGINDFSSFVTPLNPSDFNLNSTEFEYFCTLAKLTEQ